MRFVPLVLLSLSFALLQSNMANGQNSSSAERLCADLSDKTQGPGFWSRLKLLKKQVDLIRDPIQFAVPTLTEIVPKTRLSHGPGKQVLAPSEARSLLFLPGPTPQIERQYERHRQAYVEGTATLKALESQWLEIARKHASNSGACADEAKTRGLDLKKYEDTLSSVRIAEWFLKQQQSLDFLIKALKDGPQRSPLRWNVQTYTRTQDIVAAVGAKTTANVMIVAHGDPAGRLVDSYLNVIEQDAFDEIQPGLFSLTLFSCFSTEALQIKYKFHERLAAAESLYPRRYVITAQGLGFFQTGDVALLAFPAFFKKADEFLSAKFQAFTKDFVRVEISDSPGSNLNSQTECLATADLSQFGLRAGAVYVQLNGRIIGYLNAEELSRRVRFACSILRSEGGNQFVVGGTRLPVVPGGLSPTAVNGSAPILKLFVPVDSVDGTVGEVEVRPTEVRHFNSVRDGRWSSSRFKF
jgi:hypothetical protein